MKRPQPQDPYDNDSPPNSKKPRMDDLFPIDQEHDDPDPLLDHSIVYDYEDGSLFVNPSDLPEGILPDTLFPFDRHGEDVDAGADEPSPEASSEKSSDDDDEDDHDGQEAGAQVSGA